MDVDVAKEHRELLQFLYACPVGLAEIAADGAIGLMNPLAMQMLLPIAKTPMITNFFAIMEAYAPELRNLVEAFDKPHGTICSSHRIHLRPIEEADTSRVRVLACTLVKLDAARFIATVEDVSRQVVQEHRLKQAEAWFSSLLDGVRDFAVVSLDAEGRIDGVDPSVLQQTLFDEEQLIGRTLEVFEGGEPGDEAAGLVAVARRDGWHLDEGWRTRRDGGRFWCQRMIAVRAAGEGSAPGSSGYSVVLREVERKGVDAAELRRLLTTDHLTGARNRAHFFEVAERLRARSLRSPAPMAVVTLDVDHFKAVNDTHGHEAGDKVLQAITTACTAILRPGDMFARLGGEEFAVLLPATGYDEAARIAERMRCVVDTVRVEHRGLCLSVTASFGCAASDAGEGTVAFLLSAADEALYEAKRSGRNRVGVLPGRAVA